MTIEKATTKFNLKISFTLQWYLERLELQETVWSDSSENTNISKEYNEASQSEESLYHDWEISSVSFSTTFTSLNMSSNNDQSIATYIFIVV